MRPLLFIASDRRELEPWVAHWNHAAPSNAAVHWARTGTWRDRGVIALANGVGAPRAAAAVQTARTLAPEFAGICSIGTAGALDPSLAIAEIVVASAVTDGVTTWPALDPHGAAARSGLVRTSPHIARTANEKKNLGSGGAIIVEMEAAGLAHAAKELAVPFYCIRVVSDGANETFNIDFEQFLTPDGRFNVPSLMMNALAHPVRDFSELLRLQRRTSAAAKQLGNFLATCDF